MNEPSASGTKQRPVSKALYCCTAARKSGIAKRMPNSPSETIVPAMLPYRNVGMLKRVKSMSTDFFARRRERSYNAKAPRESAPIAIATGTTETSASGHQAHAASARNPSDGAHQP